MQRGKWTDLRRAACRGKCWSLRSQYCDDRASVEVDRTELNELELLITSIDLFTCDLNKSCQGDKSSRLVPNSSIADKAGTELHDWRLSLVAAVVSGVM